MLILLMNWGLIAANISLYISFTRVSLIWIIYICLAILLCYRMLAVLTKESSIYDYHNNKYQWQNWFVIYTYCSTGNIILYITVGNHSPTDEITISLDGRPVSGRRRNQFLETTIDPAMEINFILYIFSNGSSVPLHLCYGHRWMLKNLVRIYNAKTGCENLI